MSRATKQKHVFQELEDPDFTIGPGQEIARVAASRGNNLHEVSTATGEQFLASMPSRFRRNAWIKRGDFVILERISEGVKVQAEIVHILYKDHIKQLKQDGVWPAQFDPQKTENKSTECDDEDGDLFVNTNRRPAPPQTTDSSSDDMSEEDDGEEDKQVGEEK